MASESSAHVGNPKTVSDAEAAELAAVITALAPADASDDVSSQFSRSRSSIGASAAWALAGAVGAGILFAAPFLIIPWLPRRVFGALPWMPTSVRKVDAVLDALPKDLVQPGRKFVDLGSGDGVAVIAAAKRGMTSVGIELNPSLVLLSRMKARSAGVAPSTSFSTGDLWKLPLHEYDVIMIFGVRPLMERLRGKLEAEASPHAYVISNKFDVPGWHDRLEHTIQDVRVYAPRAKLTTAQIHHINHQFEAAQQQLK